MAARHGDARADGAYVTTQETAKSLKVQEVISAGLLILGLVMVFSAPADSSSASVAGLCIFVGLIWFLGVRIAIWWRHG